MKLKPIKLPDPHAVIHAAMAACYTASCLGFEKGMVLGAIAGCYALLAIPTH